MLHLFILTVVTNSMKIETYPIFATDKKHALQSYKKEYDFTSSMDLVAEFENMGATVKISEYPNIVA